jgi:hypothetical protein
MKTICLMFALAIPQAAHAKKVQVPIDVGVGPAALIWTGAIAQDQLVHYGLSISAAAVLDKKFLRQNKKLIPKQYRRQVTQMDEIRIGYLLIPDTLIISPKTQNTGMYGVNWSPVSLSMPLVQKPFDFKATADLMLTYTFIHSDDDAIGTTHFLRPGLGLGANLEVPLGGRFYFSMGWRSALYVPQAVGGSVLDLGLVTVEGESVEFGGELNQTIWHVGQGSAQLHYRFPFVTRL